jgi:Raf kinase inhibitor-like YbhB/YbcL family protein
MALTLTSPVFQHEGSIPPRYTCDGENISPELHIDGVPDGTASLVILMDDPDIPISVKQARGIDTFDHWVIYNIEPGTRIISEGVSGVGFGLNTRGTVGYTGPCPPDREHRYFFRVYALSDTLAFASVPTLREVEEAAKGIMIESAILIGRYERARP